ncbi:hypothetical protein TRFO_26642 [Tritrichomonas foetus]|uniref:Uncharacterized protein n=1 Tax=Tritrichomonas foetus TaxID=1144522 RepID=A0A1J4K786_9EUKA|nr:hypothetical protein TRFO_26642 [Tritrichomonas foetus]|eukprot:OHT05572.1 hypothetical protein TRFO_26642 [Tritrichomonas foetus]
MGNSGSNSGISYPKAVTELAETKGIPIEVAYVVYSRFSGISDKKDKISKATFQNYFPFVSQNAFDNMLTYLNVTSFDVSLANFSDLYLCISPAMSNTKMIELLYGVFVTENGFCYDAFIDELQANMITKTQNEIEILRTEFEEGIENPNGCVTHENYLKKLETIKIPIIDLAKNLIFSSFIFQ